MLMATLNSNHIRIRYLDISIRQAGNNGIFVTTKLVGTLDRETANNSLNPPGLLICIAVLFKKSIAIGMVIPELATTGQKLRIDILGKMHDVTILDESPYDPENKLLRA